MVITPNVDFSYSRQLAAQVWEFIITELEIKEKEQAMTKIRHYRNMDYNPCLDQLSEQPVVVDASELDGIFNMEDLYYSNFATELEVSYKAKGVHLSFYKAYSAQF